MKVTQDRLDLMDDATVTVGGVEYTVKDPLSLEYRDFEAKRRASEHRVVQLEVRRPDLLAHSEYGEVGYWWFIAAVNGVVNPFEMPEGEALKVPQLLDYYEWYRDQKGS